MSTLFPRDKVQIDEQAVKKHEALISQQQSEIERLQKQIKAMSKTLTAEKEQKQESRSFAPTDLSEFKTRKI